VTLNLKEQARTIANYLPSGRAFGAKTVDGSITNRLLCSFGHELLRSDALLEQFRTEILPDETLLFLDEWESAVGIPDDCFTGAGTDDERRRDILAKLVSLGVQTVGDFLALANIFGVDATIKGGSTHGAFPFELPMIFFPDSRTARHTILVDFTAGLVPMFPLSFPLPFGAPEQAMVQCLFSKVKPANVDILYVDIV
jgi:hypothetical protein